MNITLRPFPADQRDFLFQLYASTREAEISALGWSVEQQEAFLRMQFSAQRQWYEMAYPQADHQLILVNEQPAGRILTFRKADAELLVDIALLSQYRNRGIGTQVLRGLTARTDEDGVPLRLQVLKSNPACRLYQRLGFVQTGDDGVYFQMERKAGG